MKWCLTLVGVVWLFVAAAGRAKANSVEYFDVDDGKEIDSYAAGNFDSDDVIELVDSTEVLDETWNGPLIGEVSPANCSCNTGSSCTCCSDVVINGKPRDFCVEGWYDSSRFAVGLDLLYSQELMKRFEISPQTVGKICAPIPLPPPFNELFKICVGNYHLTLDFDKRNAMICIYAQITTGFPLFTVDFNCFKYANETFSLDNSIEFTGKGLLHFDVSTLEFELNVPDEVKEFIKDEAERIVTEFKKKETIEDQIEFVAETYWRYTPLKYIIEAVQEVAPQIPGAVDYAIDEAGKAINDFAAECSRDLAKIDRLDDKIAYMAKRLSIFTGPGILYKGYKKVSPFVEGVAKFTYEKVSTAVQEIIVDILREAATIEDPVERAAFFAKKYVEYTPAGIMYKAVEPFVSSLANKAVETISSMAEDVRDNLIANLTKMDNPADQTYHVLKTVYKFTPFGMLLSSVGAEKHLDAAYEAAKKGVNTMVENAEKDIVGGYENAETTGDKVLHVVTTAAKLANPISLIYHLFTWG